MGKTFWLAVSDKTGIALFALSSTPSDCSPSLSPSTSTFMAFGRRPHPECLTEWL